MNESFHAATAGSLTLWALAALVAFLSSHVALGWIRQAQRAPASSPIWAPVLLACSALGTGVGAAALMGFAALPLTFALAFRHGIALALWLGAMLAMAPVVVWLIKRPAAPAYAGGGLLAATVALSLQVGWIWAAGLQPGVLWQPAFLAVAGATMAIGFAAAFAIANSLGTREGSHRGSWRLGADMLAGLTVIAGQELTSRSANLLSQIGSIHHLGLSASMLALACAGVLPIVLAILALDLFTRRQMLQQKTRDGSSTLGLDRPRRSHKHKRHAPRP